MRLGRSCRQRRAPNHVRRSPRFRGWRGLKLLPRSLANFFKILPRTRGHFVKAGFGLKRKNVPDLPIYLHASRSYRLTHECGDGIDPETKYRRVRFHDANLPEAGKLPPHLMGDLSSYPSSAQSTNDEKLRHIPDTLVAQNPRHRLYESESRPSPIYLKKKRMTTGLAPIKRKRLVAELAIGPQRHIVEFAEIMQIQLK